MLEWVRWHTHTRPGICPIWLTDWLWITETELIKLKYVLHNRNKRTKFYKHIHVTFTSHISFIILQWFNLSCHQICEGVQGRGWQCPSTSWWWPKCILLATISASSSERRHISRKGENLINSIQTIGVILHPTIPCCQCAFYRLINI